MVQVEEMCPANHDPFNVYGQYTGFNTRKAGELLCVFVDTVYKPSA